MSHAVTLGFDDPSAAHVERLWTLLARESISRSCLRNGYRPHVTLGVYGEIGDAEAAVAALKRFSAARAGGPVSIRFVGLGIFPGHGGPGRRNVLWAVPVNSADLLDLHAGLHRTMPGEMPCNPFYQVGRWTPHCTLADDLDATALARAVATLAPHWKPFTAHLDRLDLVRFHPVELLFGTRL